MSFTPLRAGFRFLLAALLALGLVQPVTATIDPALQMLLGNPSNATSDTNNHNHFLVVRPVEAFDYNDVLGVPNWASWNLTAADLGNSGRSDNFFTDTNLPSNFVLVRPNDYSGSGYDRGHLCPSADRTDNTNDNDMVFYMSNIMPQTHTNNAGPWGGLESYCRTLANASNELLIICGPRGFSGARVPSGKAAIPDYTWKVVVVVTNGPGLAINRVTTNSRVIAIDIPNSFSVSPAWQDYITSPGQIQRDTGLTFFTALPGPLASALRARVDGEVLPPPQVVSFSPEGGGPGTNVIITGTNFDSAISVTFNGIPSVFSLDSNIQITAAVPFGATTGPIVVTTPTGSSSSATLFNIGTAIYPDLAVSLTHTGTFTQGDTNDTYSITITNVGTGVTFGSVAVSNFVPAGLNPVSVSGDGWAIDNSSISATRSDALAPGAGFAPIFVTVSVASNAPASVTNRVAVDGGGDTNLANNAALDLISIIAVSTNPVPVLLAGWDANGITNFGPSVLPPSVTCSNLIVTGLSRGAGVGTNGSSALRAWGGNTWTNSTSAAAIASNQFFTLSLSASNGYQLSLSSISRFEYRRSSTGPTSGLLQYQLGEGPFVDILSISYPATTNIGASAGPIDLSHVEALQHVGAGTNVALRIVNYGGTNPAGTWYIFDTASNASPDFAVSGNLIRVYTPIESWRLAFFGTPDNAGAAADEAVNSSDGLPNLVKYALGLNPLQPALNPISGDTSDGFLQITVPRNPAATDVSFQLLISDNIAGPWTTNGITIELDTPSLLRAHSTNSVAATPMQFIRAQVSRP